MRLDLIAPLLIELAGAVATLVVVLFLPRVRQGIGALLAAVTLLAAAGALAPLHGLTRVAFDGSYAVDALSFAAQALFIVVGLLVIVLSYAPLKGDAREGEYYVFILFALVGAGVLAGARDFMVVILGVLLLSVPSYVLVAYRRSDPLALEAVLKYYLFGAFTNVALLYGAILVYGLGATTRLAPWPTLVAGDAPLLLGAFVLIWLGLGFKVGAWPVHFWVPDAYQGALPAVAALISVLGKVAGLIAFARVVQALAVARPAANALIAIVSLVSMTWGNLAAFRQDDVRRLLAYSSVAQAGYMLMALVAWPAAAAEGALRYYFLAYLVANVGAFAVVAAAGEATIAGLRGLARARPAPAAAMALALLSLMGLPPLAGFVAKFLVFTAAFQAGYAWLAVAGAINSVLSLFYYLRVIAPLYLDAPTHDFSSRPGAGFVAALCALAIIVVGLAAPVFVG